MIIKCTDCQKTFEQNQTPKLTELALAVGRDTERPVCYACALEQLIGRRAPEEGDFNSAHLISGEMSDKEWRWFQEDMGMVKAEWRPEPAFGEDYEDDSEFVCRTCGHFTDMCSCEEDEY
ncbi:MAG: hypothetical protein P4M11_05630 [Candidatus Pacebacteria bacterium]|nr:hypothetical protein [Candidatus Paceibacterota bacterium]